MASKPRAAGPWERKLREGLYACGVRNGDSVLLAVSGGLDSMTMLDMCARLSSLLGIRLIVAHFDHRLRGVRVGTRELRFVQTQSALRKLPFVSGWGDVKARAARMKESLEEAARECRYAFLVAAAKENGCTFIATAHTADDNAETLLLNLLRGAGPSGLSGIPHVNNRYTISVIRPLLSFTRSELERVAVGHNVDHITDESNSDMRFRRNRIRSEVLPLLRTFNPDIVRTLNRTASVMHDADEMIGKSVRQRMERIVLGSDDEIMKLRYLNSLPEMLRTACLRYRLAQMDPTLQYIDYNAVQRVMDVTVLQTGTQVDLVQGYSVLRDRDRLLLVRPQTDDDAETVFAPGDRVILNGTVLITELTQATIVRAAIRSGDLKTGVLVVDSDRIDGAQLTIRQWHRGDRMQPYGMRGSRKVSDILTDRKIPRNRKSHIRVICDAERIVCICGIEIDDRYKITSKTRRVLTIELKTTV